VCHSNEWATLCRDSWSNSEGLVACRQLGLPYQIVNTAFSFGPGAGWIWLDNIRCNRSETRLIDCAFDDYGYCQRGTDAGLICACKCQTMLQFVKFSFYIIK